MKRKERKAAWKAIREESDKQLETMKKQLEMMKMMKKIEVLYLNTEDFRNEVQTYKNKDELIQFIKDEVYEWSCLDEDEEPTVIVENNVYTTEEFGSHHIWIII